jgi:hypothetical protein
MVRTVIAGLGGAVAGFLLGATLGGNFMADVELAGSRGYEAAGPIGAIVGAVLGVVVAAAMAARRSKLEGAVGRSAGAARG